METTINRFEKQLEKWNRGVLRGAQAKLAKCLRVSTATVALWTTGQRHPSKGYLAQMARLFHLEIAQVERLFRPFPTSVVETSFPVKQPFMLRDAPGDGVEYGPSLRTVSLPVFTHVPASYPYYTLGETKGWWTVPQTAVRKARFLFALPGKNDPDRLLFIEPSSTWRADRVMLGKKGSTYKLVRVRREQGKIILQTTPGKRIALSEICPVGIVVRQLTDISF